MKQWYQSKTLWVNAISFLIVVLGTPEIVSLLGTGALPYLAAVLALANILMRFLTTEPIRGPLSK